MTYFYVFLLVICVWSIDIAPASWNSCGMLLEAAEWSCCILDERLPGIVTTVYVHVCVGRITCLTLRVDDCRHVT